MKVLRIAKSILILTFVTIFLVVSMDIAVRVYLSVKNKDIRFLKFNPTITQRVEFPLPEKEDFGAYYKFKSGIYYQLKICQERFGKECDFLHKVIRN